MHTRSDLGSWTNLRAALWVGKHECHKRLQDLPVSYFLFFFPPPLSFFWRGWSARHNDEIGGGVSGEMEWDRDEMKGRKRRKKGGGGKADMRVRGGEGGRGIGQWLEKVEGERKGMTEEDMESERAQRYPSIIKAEFSVALIHFHSPPPHPHGVTPLWICVACGCS